MIKTVLLLSILLAHGVCSAQTSIYKHLGGKGEIIYSDHYLKGSEQAELPELTVLPASQRLSKASPSIAKMEANESLQAYEAEEAEQIATHQPRVIQSAKAEKVMQLNEVSSNHIDEVELSPEERLQLIIDDMELYDDDIDRLELELYKIGADY